MSRQRRGQEWLRSEGPGRRGQGCERAAPIGRGRDKARTCSRDASTNLHHRSARPQRMGVVVLRPKVRHIPGAPSFALFAKGGIHEPPICSFAFPALKPRNGFKDDARASAVLPTIDAGEPSWYL